MKKIVGIIVLVGLLILAVGSILVSVASDKTQNIMRQSKSIKEIYGQGAQGKAEEANRNKFDAIFKKYMKSDQSTLLDDRSGIKQSDMDMLNKLAPKTGEYYKDAYSDKAKMVSLIGGIQNDYLKLFTKTGVDQRFSADTKPSDIYNFNATHYDDLQTILAINADSQYPAWMIGKMQAMGSDAIAVEALIQKFAKYFTYPSAVKPWMVSHEYTVAVGTTLTESYHALHYTWRTLLFISDVITASTVVGADNESMQAKVDQANAQIASIQSASEASSRAKAESESIASSQKASSEASAKSSSDAAESSRKASESQKQSSSQSNNDNNNNNNQNSSSSTNQMPNFVGKSIDEATNWARDNHVDVDVKQISDGNYQNNQIVTQNHINGKYFLTVFKK